MPPLVRISFFHSTIILLVVNGASGTIEVYDGDRWNVVRMFTDTTTNSEKEILDISTYAGSVPKFQDTISLGR